MTTDKVITECHNWESREVITYERLGECNQCGDCCKRRFDLGETQREYPGGDPTPKMGLPTIGYEGDWGTFAGERNFFQFVDSGKEANCSMYCEIDGKGSCGIQGLKEHEQLCCEVFPQVPSQLDTLPNCSYSFTEVNRRDMDREDGYKIY